MKNKFKIGQTVYYIGRNDSTFYTLRLSDNNKSAPVEEKIVYNEPVGKIIESVIIEYLDSGHSLGRGYFDEFKLENGNTISSYLLYSTWSECETANKPKIVQTKTHDDFDGIELPKITRSFPKLLADDIISIIPISNETN